MLSSSVTIIGSNIYGTSGCQVIYNNCGVNTSVEILSDP